VDIRIADYTGLDPAKPLDVTSSGGGRSALPSSGAATTTTAAELLVGAGTTTGHFTDTGSGYTTRIITEPRAPPVSSLQFASAAYACHAGRRLPRRAGVSSSSRGTRAAA
jgi:hypothetical protein